MAGAGLSCPETLAGDRINVVSRGAVPSSDSVNVYYLCVRFEDVLAAAGEALTAAPGSILVIPGPLWRPELAAALDGSTVVVAGYLPEPGLDQAPAADVMGLTLGLPPWSGGLLDGYTAALSMHAVLELALLDGDLTRDSVREMSEAAYPTALGLGGIITRSRGARPTTRSNKCEFVG